MTRDLQVAQMEMKSRMSISKREKAFADRTARKAARSVAVAIEENRKKRPYNFRHRHDPGYMTLEEAQAEMLARRAFRNRDYEKAAQKFRSDLIRLLCANGWTRFEAKWAFIELSFKRGGQHLQRDVTDLMNGFAEALQKALKKFPL